MSVGDTIWSDWKEIAEKNGVSRELFERRIWDNRAKPRWGDAEAALTPPNKWRRRVVKNKREERMNESEIHRNDF